MQADEAARLVLDTEQRVARVIVGVAEIDLRVAEPLQEVLREAANADVERLEIDLSGVSFADSSVVRLAMQVREWVGPRHAQVAIEAPPAVRKVFDITDTARHFEIIESVGFPQSPSGRFSRAANREEKTAARDSEGP